MEGSRISLAKLTAPPEQWKALYFFAPLIREVIRDARRKLPNEACGLIGGAGEVAGHFYPCRNTLQSPSAYSMAPHDIVASCRRMEELGERLVAIVHSHPNAPAWPSQADREQAFYPEVVYLIVSLSGSEPVLRGFQLVDGKVFKVPLRPMV